MPNWYYSYKHGGKTITNAIAAPDLPHLEFTDVCEQLVVPYLCARGVSAVDTVQQAAEAEGIEPIPAVCIAEIVTIQGVQYSLESTEAKNLPSKTQQQGLCLRPVSREYLHEATAIWNEIVESGDSFPGDKLLSEEEAWTMFEEQTASVCAVHGGEVVGVYILHPNNIGRCGHIANASYAVKSSARGRGVGRALVEDCIRQAKVHGFRGLQFNAVVCTNTSAIALYIKLGFHIIGTVPGGYRYKETGYRDTLIMIKTWA